MRSKAIALATATGAVLGCGEESEYAWGMPYQPAAAVDDDEDENPPEDDQEPSTEESGPPPAADGPASTPGVDPMLTDSASGEATGSSGEPGESADTGQSPYQGGWDVGDCQDEMASQVADFFLTDSFGDQIRLYDFCHKAIFLTAGSFW
jgi:hypothetical protein